MAKRRPMRFDASGLVKDEFNHNNPITAKDIKPLPVETKPITEEVQKVVEPEPTIDEIPIEKIDLSSIISSINNELDEPLVENDKSITEQPINNVDVDDVVIENGIKDPNQAETVRELFELHKESNRKTRSLSELSQSIMESYSVPDTTKNISNPLYTVNKDVASNGNEIRSLLIEVINSMDNDTLLDFVTEYSDIIPGYNEAFGKKITKAMTKIDKDKLSLLLKLLSE